MTPIVGQLLLLNVVGFLLAGPGSPLQSQLHLVPADVLTEPWTLITYQFMHGSTTHIFFNMLGLFFFGPRLEVRLGSRHFVSMYLFAGLVGAIAHIIMTLLLASPGALGIPMVGASAAVYGILFAYARYWPRDKVLLWFVVPVEVRVLVIGFTVLSLVAGIRGGGNVAHFAHLGGFLGGWAYLKWRDWRSPSTQFQKKVESPAVRMRESELTARWKKIDPDALHPVNREEYDRISGKIRSLGWNALTDRERTFVDRFGGALS